MNLYELSSAYQQIQSMIEDGQEELEDTLSSLNDAIEDKAEGYARIIKNLEGQAVAFKAEEERLANKRRSLEANAKRLKKALEQAMLDVGMKKVKTKLFSINIQRNAPSLDVLNTSEIPNSYFVPQDPVLDKKALLADLKNGAEVPGAQVKESESLRIR